MALISIVFIFSHANFIIFFFYSHALYFYCFDASERAFAAGPKKSSFFLIFFFFGSNTRFFAEQIKTKSSGQKINVSLTGYPCILILSPYSLSRCIGGVEGGGLLLCVCVCGKHFIFILCVIVRGGANKRPYLPPPPQSKWKRANDYYFFFLFSRWTARTNRPCKNSPLCCCWTTAQYSDDDELQINSLLRYARANMNWNV